MLQIIRKTYGPPSVLKCLNVPKPKIKKDELLIKIKASSINAADIRILTGTPFMIRIYLLFSKINVLGKDISGIVEEKGSQCSDEFSVGDEVFGELDLFGGFSEYICVKESRIVKKPSNLAFTEAASLPLAGITALQSLRAAGTSIKSGDNILINGGASGVGHLAIQIAKAKGARVTAIVSNADKVEFIKKLGADTCIDSSITDIGKESLEKFDLILNVAAYQNFTSFLHLLKKNGKYVHVGGSMNEMFKSMFYKNTKSFLALANKEDLKELAQLAEEGKLKPVIDSVFPLKDVELAMQKVIDRKVKGKVAISIN
jgi:NADPH:quinone reductase-like Zn-dependent oxidoreductase